MLSKSWLSYKLCYLADGESDSGGSTVSQPGDVTGEPASIYDPPAGTLITPGTLVGTK